ncbi:hypothetical protein B0H11DRAFT_2278519 [Mycena galericulata]|nr:hypothetical protein B0H11DRAFT_2278519 [Mycena galericulata]
MAADDIDMTDFERYNQCFAEREESGFYASMLEQITAMPNALANIEYIGTKKRSADFFRGEDWAKNVVFKDGMAKEASEYRATVFGEIAEPRYGTKVQAHGNHYDGRDDEPFKPVDDKSKIRDALVLRAPTGCSLEFKNVFDNQSALVQDIENTEVAAYTASGMTFDFRSPLRSSRDDLDAKDMITVLTKKKYGVPASAGGPRVVPAPAHVARVKRKYGNDDDSEESEDGAGETAGPRPNDNAVKIPKDSDIKLGAFYDPRVLEDYGGPYFNHVNAKLAQLDIRDANNQLIPPWKQYAALRPGSIVLASVTMHIYSFGQRKFFQLVAQTIKVLDESDHPVQTRIRPVPRNLVDTPAYPSVAAGPSTPKRSGGGGVGFSNFVVTPRSSPAKVPAANSSANETAAGGGNVEMAAVFDLVPETDAEASELNYILRFWQTPRFPAFQYGFFYGTQCRSRKVVAVPVDLGINRLNSVNDLVTECWVPSTQAPNIRDMSLGRLRIDHFPYASGFKLDYSYTVFYVPQTSVPAHIPLNRCPPIERAQIPWYGNILVVRHGRRKPVINVDPMDARLVDLIIAR